MEKQVTELTVYTVFLDGIDKTGKDTIRQYVWRLNKALNVFCRGYISLEAYNRKFNRNVAYADPYKDALYVLLTVDETDWQIRCDVTNEPKIDYQNDTALFDDVCKELEQKGYNVARYDTSRQSAYDIAKSIIRIVKALNEKCLHSK